MKISPLAQGGTPGQVLGNVEIGKTTTKMERARALARGETPAEASANGDSQSERIKSDIRRLKMRTNFSTNRDEPLPIDNVVAENVQTDKASAAAIEIPATDAVEGAESIIPDTTEQAVIEDTKPLSPQFAALAKQKRALQLERAEFDKLKQQLVDQHQGITSATELVAKLKSNPLSVLQEHGVTYDQLTEAILSGQGTDPEIQALKDKIAALEKGVDTKFQTREEQSEEAALTEMLYEAEALAKEGDAFEMIREGGSPAYDKVLRLIHTTYKKTGRVLDVSEAMGKIELQLLNDAEKFARIKKVQNKIAAPSPQSLQSQKPGMRTLTARDTASPISDKRARALAAFAGTLKR
jgi:hypothetical protein